MSVHRSKLPLLAASALAAVVLSGCVTSKRYRMVEGALPPPAPLNYVAAGPSLELRLVTVIVHEGPGSWKKKAIWDEYGICLTNRGKGPLLIESAGLVDVLHAEQQPGPDPWDLERRSEANWEKYARVGKFVLGMGAAAGAIEVAAIGYGLAGGVLSGVFFIMPAALVADVAVVGVMNQRNKGKVEAEFDRRRLVFPLTLAAGQSVTGSCFFPVSPGPQRLIVRGRDGEAPVELALGLKPLAGLHLKPPGMK